MSKWKKNKPVENDRLSALEMNMKSLAESVKSLADALRTPPTPVKPVENAQEAPVEQAEPQSEPLPQNTEPPAPAPGYEPGKQVAKQFAPVVAKPPVFNKPHIIARMGDSVQPASTPGGAHMTKAIGMMQKMKELEGGGQGMTVSDDVMFHNRSGGGKR